MLADQRLENILDLIRQQEFVQVDDLASRLNVSAMTIRRDLEKLNGMGLVQRKHGGAAALSVMRYENEYADKQGCYLDGKINIAKTAMQFIRDGDTIFLDGGTTTFQIAHLLAARDGLTVLTNDIMIALELTDKDIQIILIGGKVQKKTKTVVGSTAVDFIRQFRVSTAFLGTVSVNREFEVLTPSIEKSYLKRAAMNIAERSFLTVDASKFYSQSLHKWSALQDYDGVITDREFSSQEQKDLDDARIVVIRAR